MRLHFSLEIEYHLKVNIETISVLVIENLHYGMSCIPGAAIGCLWKVQFADFRPYAWRALAKIRSTTIAPGLNIFASDQHSILLLLAVDTDD
jgi:hypothetical protein